jgi:hypothetical protein
MLTLLGLIIGFTFSMAVSRYEPCARNKERIPEVRRPNVRAQVDV